MTSGQARFHANSPEIKKAMDFMSLTGIAFERLSKHHLKKLGDVLLYCEDRQTKLWLFYETYPRGDQTAAREPIPDKLWRETPYKGAFFEKAIMATEINR